MDAELKEKLDKVFEELSDIQDWLNEKDYQILHIMNEIDALKEKINS